jgi:HlyD family secretion protein
MKKLLYFSLYIFLTTSCSENKEFYLVKKGDITESVYASGIIESKNQYMVYPTINGTLEMLYVDEGNVVQAGDSLASILNNNTVSNQKNAEIIAEYNNYDSQINKIKDLELNAKQVEGKFKLDSINFERNKQLFEKELISKSDFEINELNYNNSKTSYYSILLKIEDLKKQLKLNDSQSKNNLNLSSLTKNDLILKSEVNGKVYSILKNKGELVTSQTPIFMIGSEKLYTIILQVDEYDIIKIKKNQTVIVNLDSYKEKTFNAKITKITPLMNERSKTFSVEAVFLNQPELLYPNLTLEGNILLSERKDVVTIPRNYLVEEKYVLNESGEKIEIKVGLKDFQKIEVIKGLSENQKIYLPEE